MTPFQIIFTPTAAAELEACIAALSEDDFRLIAQHASAPDVFSLVVNTGVGRGGSCGGADHREVGRRHRCCPSRWLHGGSDWLCRQL